MTTTTTSALFTPATNPLLSLNPNSMPKTASLRLSGRQKIRTTVRAVPGPNTYLFAFLFPFSMLAATVFTSIRIADKLDEDFLQELAVNQAILEAVEDDEDDDLSISEEPERPRARNRPKREAEVTSL